MKNFRNLSALILSAAASLTLLAGCGAAPVEDTCLLYTSDAADD